MPDYGTGLFGLFTSSFLSATLLPGGSEILLFALIRSYPGRLAEIVAIATFGNTLGGMSTYFLARLFPDTRQPKNNRQISVVRRFGCISLLLSWSPIVGDALCAIAGWLRLDWRACVLWMTIGKATRYLLVASGALSF